MTDEDKLIREKIINVAKRLAMADGLYLLSVEDIIKGAEISEETFYKFFKDSHEVGLELFYTRFGITDDNVLILPLREKIKFVTSELMKQHELANVEICRRWLTENLNPANVNSDFGKWLTEDLNSTKVISNDKELMRKVLRSSIESGELRKDTPEEKLADFIVNTLYGMLVNWCMTDGKAEPLEKIDTFSDFMINSLAAYKN